MWLCVFGNKNVVGHLQAVVFGKVFRNSAWEAIVQAIPCC